MSGATASNREVRVQMADEEAAEAAEAAERAAERELGALQHAVRHCVRTDALGSDRHHRRYHVFGHCNDLVWVESKDGDRVGVLHTPEQLAAVEAALLPRGPRERDLAAAFAASRADGLLALRPGGHAQVSAGFTLAQFAASEAPPPAPPPPPPPPVDTRAAPLVPGTKPCTAAPVVPGKNGKLPAVRPGIREAASAYEEGCLPPDPVFCGPMTPEQAEAAGVARGVTYLRALFATFRSTDTGVAECDKLEATVLGVATLADLFSVCPSSAPTYQMFATKHFESKTLVSASMCSCGTRFATCVSHHVCLADLRVRGSGVCTCAGHQGDGSDGVPTEGGAAARLWRPAPRRAAA